MPLDMDIINAAMVKQRSAEDLATAQAANAKNKQKTELGQDDFLALMITQLKNQDPFKPLDPQEQVAQLAQFSSVSGIKEMNTSISNLTASLRGNQVLDGASLIGHTVVAENDQVYLGALSDDRTGVYGSVTVPTGTSGLQMIVKNSSGATVLTKALDPKSGLRGFNWDGKDDSGTALPGGGYQIQIMATVAGTTESLKTSIAAGVSSVALNPTTGALMLDTDALGEIPMSSIERVL
jgi:flagellar basal-body rod modification protein FlgD